MQIPEKISSLDCSNKDIELLKVTVDKIAAASKDNGLIIFAGAGISAIEPTKCPTWSPLCLAILQRIFNKLVAVNFPKNAKIINMKSKLNNISFRPETFLWGLSQILRPHVWLRLLNVSEIQYQI